MKGATAWVDVRMCFREKHRGIKVRISVDWSTVYTRERGRVRELGARAVCDIGGEKREVVDICSSWSRIFRFRRCVFFFFFFLDGMYKWFN